MSTDGILFLNKIKNKRAYADRLSSDSDHSVQNMTDNNGAFKTLIASDEAESVEENDRITKINFSEGNVKQYLIKTIMCVLRLFGGLKSTV